MGRKKFREYGVDDVLHAMEEIVAEFGNDYVYDRFGRDDRICRYAHEDGPGCLVGQVLVRLGADLNVIKSVESAHIDRRNTGLSLEELLDELAPTWGSLGYTLTPEAVEVLTVAQNMQDVRNTWGRALKRAQERAQELSMGAK